MDGVPGRCPRGTTGSLCLTHLNNHVALWFYLHEKQKGSYLGIQSVYNCAALPEDVEYGLYAQLYCCWHDNYWYSPIMWSVHFDISSPTTLVITHRYSPSVQASMLENLSVAVSAPWADPPEETFCHSPLQTPSKTGFHCHWYLSGSVPVAWTVNDTGFPGTVFFNSCGWAVILGRSASE